MFNMQSMYSKFNGMIILVNILIIERVLNDDLLRLIHKRLLFDIFNVEVVYVS